MLTHAADGKSGGEHIGVARVGGIPAGGLRGALESVTHRVRVHIKLLGGILQRTAVPEERGDRQIGRVIGIVAALYTVNVPIQFFAGVIVTQQRTFRQQFIRTQRARLRR